MPLVIQVLALTINLIPFLPHPIDKHGWGLRVHNFSGRGPYLVGEAIDRVRFDVTLINFSKETRSHDPLIVAKRTRDLDIAIFQPDGKPAPALGGPALPRPELTQQNRLRPREFYSQDFRFAGFGYHGLIEPGRYRIEVTLRIDEKTIKSPPIEFDVIEPPADAVLVSHKVPLEGRELMLPVLEQCKPVIQQMKVGNRTLLIYRRVYDPKSGGGIFLTARLAE